MAWLTPQRAHTARAFGTGTAADVLTQGQHGFAVECIPKIMLHRRIRWPGYEETGLHVPAGTDNRRELRSIATHGRKRRFAQERGKILVDSAELCRALGNEAAVKIFRTLPFQGGQQLFEHRQVIRTQRNICGELVSASERMRVCDINREE